MFGRFRQEIRRSLFAILREWMRERRVRGAERVSMQRWLRNECERYLREAVHARLQRPRAVRGRQVRMLLRVGRTRL